MMRGIEMQAIRETLGLTVGELAEELGATPRSVSRWVAGEIPIPNRVEAQMVNLLDMMGAAVRKAAADPLPLYEDYRDYIRKYGGDEMWQRYGFGTTWGAYKALLGAVKLQDSIKHTSKQ